MLIKLLVLVATITAIIVFLHWYSYRHLKTRIVEARDWDLNICCGKFDGGGVNVDIVRHADLPNFVRVDNVYQLPFDDQQFDTVLCSHTAEHVDDPDRFDRELRRVGKTVVYVLPPVWDLAAALNVLEHRWIFLSLRKVHYRLPRRVKLPFARRLQATIGQRVNA
ncbi:MAG: methyltransferase domain-containing protein [Pseudomonadota bacterium]